MTDRPLNDQLKVKWRLHWSGLMGQVINHQLIDEPSCGASHVSVNLFQFYLTLTRPKTIQHQFQLNPSLQNLTLNLL